MSLKRIQTIVSGGFRNWSLNSSEISGWIRLCAPLFLWIGALRRSWRQIFSVLAFIAASPYLFSPSAEDTWMNRAMRGERAWMQRGRLDLSHLLCIGGIGCVKLAVFTGLLRRYWVSLLWLLSGTVLTAWHFDRMSSRFEQERTFEETRAEEARA